MLNLKRLPRHTSRSPGRGKRQPIPAAVSPISLVPEQPSTSRPLPRTPRITSCPHGLKWTFRAELLGIPGVELDLLLLGDPGHTDRCDCSAALSSATFKKFSAWCVVVARRWSSIFISYNWVTCFVSPVANPTMKRWSQPIISASAHFGVCEHKISLTRKNGAELKTTAGPVTAGRRIPSHQTSETRT